MIFVYIFHFLTILVIALLFLFEAKRRKKNIVVEKKDVINGRSFLIPENFEPISQEILDRVFFSYPQGLLMYRDTRGTYYIDKFLKLDFLRIYESLQEDKTI